MTWDEWLMVWVLGCMGFVLLHAFAGQLPGKWAKLADGALLVLLVLWTALGLIAKAVTP